MSEFDKEIPRLSSLDQLKQVMQTHQDNLKDLQQTVKMFSLPQDIVFSTYFATLKSDMLIIKGIIKRMEDEL